MTKLTITITITITITLLLLTNLAWAIAYERLWQDAAQTEGLLDEAQTYIHQQQK